MQHAHKTGLLKIKIGAENKLSKSVIQCDSQGNPLRKWDSTMDIERKLKIHHSHISKCCKGKQKVAGGFIWRYENEEKLCNKI